MTLTQTQFTEILTVFANEKGLHSLLQLTLNTIMLSERALYLDSNQDSGNGPLSIHLESSKLAKKSITLF